VSKLGGGTAFAAEAAIWIAGVALIAGAAGMHWETDLQNALNELTGSTPSAATSAEASAGASASPAVSPTATGAAQSLAPGASPTLSPLVAKFQAYITSPGYQVRGKYTIVMAFTVKGTPYEEDVSGTFAYKAGDTVNSYRATVGSAVATYDIIDVGSAEYKSENGQAWKKSARSAASAASDRLLFAPTLLMVDKGVETKNGAQLRRLEVADPPAFSKAFLKASTGLTDVQVTYTAWVTDEGTQAAIKVEGWEDGTVLGTKARVTILMEFRIIATSGVTISAPI
jgi:hypothetical protein